MIYINVCRCQNWRHLSALVLLGSSAKFQRLAPLRSVPRLLNIKQLLLADTLF